MLLKKKNLFNILLDEMGIELCKIFIALLSVEHISTFSESYIAQRNVCMAVK